MNLIANLTFAMLNLSRYTLPLINHLNLFYEIVANRKELSLIEKHLQKNASGHGHISHPDVSPPNFGFRYASEVARPLVTHFGVISRKYCNEDLTFVDETPLA